MRYRAYLNSLVNEGYGSRLAAEHRGNRERAAFDAAPARLFVAICTANRSEELNLFGLQRFEDILHVCTTGHEQGALA
jgi:hypothetical protein